jgi:hypothetical protein
MGRRLTLCIRGKSKKNKKKCKNVLTIIVNGDISLIKINEEPKQRRNEMKAPERIIEKAAELAYEEDAYMIIGRIQGEWRISHNEDMGRISSMKAPIFAVDSSGLIED